MKSKINHDIKHRETPNNEFYTPKELAKMLIEYTPIKKEDTIFESAYGTGNFYSQFPKENKIGYSKDFFNETKKWDWIITNPHYSKLDDWFNHTIKLSNKGFGLLIGWNNLTARRIEMCNKEGFGLTKINMFKVFKWFGMSCYCVFEKDKKNIIDIERTVWRSNSNSSSAKAESFNKDPDIKSNFRISPISKVKHKNGRN